MSLNDRQSRLELGEVLEPRRGSPGRRWQRGQSLVIVALMLVVLVGSLALVIDLGNVYAQRRLMQNAADAGALAGARALGLGQGDDAVYAAVEEYAKARNGARSCATTIKDPVVTVVVTKTVGTFFASIIGVPTITVPAVAAARYSPLDDVHGGLLLPLIISDSIWLRGLDSSHPITIWDSPPKKDFEGGPWDVFGGGRGWLNINLSGQGAAYPKEVVCDMDGTEYPRELTTTDWVPGSDGLANGVLREFDSCREGTEVIFPLFDDWCMVPSTKCEELGFYPSTGPANHYYHISGFAVFEIERVDPTGDPKAIVGTFITRYIYLPGHGDDEYEDPVTGPVSVFLVR